MQNTDPFDSDLTQAMSGRTLFGILSAVVIGALGAAVLVPAALPDLTQSLLGSEPKAYWYLSRSSAIVSYVLLWISMIFGLMITTRTAHAWPGGPATLDLHQQTSLMALALALFHGLILLVDSYIGYNLRTIAVPFASVDYKPFEVGLGQIGFYVMALVGLSFYVKKTITQRGWRLIHFLSFAMFVLALVHGLQAGTDSSGTFMSLLYWVSGSSVLLMTVFRILLKVTGRRQTADRKSQTIERTTGASAM
ncbi:MAG: ferric reductase-like transmembrane domain-containing protein [Chloroflexi bacterium]|nr:ferric reductase-like transmembrane domain-containing protein [Chloroflexota bacterium]